MSRTAIRDSKRAYRVSEGDELSQRVSDRVAELRTGDEQLLLNEFEKIALSLSRLFDRAQSVAQDELKAEIFRAELVGQALAFVISVRTQETAIMTWFSEAFYRDCGACN